MCQMWSLKITSTDTIGRTYFKRKSTSIMIAKILKFAMEEKCDSSSTFNLFLKELLRCEIHEQLHIFLDQTLRQWRCSEKLISHYDVILERELAEILGTDYVKMYWEVLEWLREKDGSK